MTPTNNKIYPGRGQNNLELYHCENSVAPTKYITRHSFNIKQKIV